jgi:hypothetical protein
MLLYVYRERNLLNIYIEAKNVSSCIKMKYILCPVQILLES